MASTSSSTASYGDTGESMTVIKVLLILGVVSLLLLVLRSHGTSRGGAYVKIGMAAFLLFAVYAVIRPEDVTWIAEQVGVGRGTDLVLYLLVVGFGFFAISTYLRFKELELRYARLARAIALADAANRHLETPADSRSPATIPETASDQGSLSGSTPSQRSAT